MSERSRCYAIIPAAGRSERMGRSKLLLPWQGPGTSISTLLDHVLQVWTSSGVHNTILVVRAEAESALQPIFRSYDVDVVLADDPPDMKASCLAGLQHLSQHYSPTPKDRFFVCPADIPGISAELVDHLLREAQRHDVARESEANDRIILPTFQGRRGHPVLFPWPIAAQLALLKSDEGVNALVNRAEVVEVESPVSAENMTDIDTPEDYATAARLLAESFRAMPPRAGSSDSSTRPDPPPVSS